MLSTVTTTASSSVVSRIPMPAPTPALDHLRGGGASSSWLTTSLNTSGGAAGGKKSPKTKTPSTASTRKSQKSRITGSSSGASSSSSAAVTRKSLLSDFYKIHEGIRFFISGNVGNVVFFFLERSLYMSLLSISWLPDVVQDYRDGISFFLAYFMQIAVQHILHAFLVYGVDSISTREKYITTLIACYSTYMVSLFGSTILNTFLIKRGINRTMSFCGTMFSFACINYFVLKYINQKEANKTNSSRMTTTTMMSNRNNNNNNNKIGGGGGGLGGRGGATTTASIITSAIYRLTRLISTRKWRTRQQPSHHHHHHHETTTTTSFAGRTHLHHDVAEECYL